MKEHELPYWTKDKKHPVELKHQTKYTSRELGENDAHEAQPGDRPKYSHPDYRAGWKEGKSGAKEVRKEEARHIRSTYPKP
jgi:hypothetical protein